MHPSPTNPMPTEPHDRAAWGQRVREQLAALEHWRGPRADAQAAQRRRLVKAWQVRRLARDHADLLNDPRYAPAALFFLEELYGPQDQHQRDLDLARVVPKMLKLLPQEALQAISLALQLDALSESLDDAVAQALAEALGEAYLQGDWSEEAYAQAFRRVGRAHDRQSQLQWVGQLGRSLDRLTRVPLLAATLKLMRRPAESAGLGELHRFLHRGHRSFTHMKGSAEFLQRVLSVERRRMSGWLGVDLA